MDNGFNSEGEGGRLFHNSNALQIVISVEVIASPLFCFFFIQRKLINEQINHLRCCMFASSPTPGPQGCVSPEKRNFI